MMARASDSPAAAASARAVTRIANVRGLRAGSSRRCRPDGPPDPPGQLPGDQQLLHRHGVKKGAEVIRCSSAARARGLPQQDGPVFLVSRRPGRHLRRLRRLHGRGQRRRSRPLHALVQPGRHAAPEGRGAWDAAAGRYTLTLAAHPAHRRPARQAAAAHPGGGRPAQARRRRPAPGARRRSRPRRHHPRPRSSRRPPAAGPSPASPPSRCRRCCAVSRRR